MKKYYGSGVNDRIMMAIAKQLRDACDIGDQRRHTSVLFVDKDGTIICSGVNRMLTGQTAGPTAICEHAERVAIAAATRNRTNLEGTTAYLPWFPCLECARMLVEVGIERMVCIEPDWSEEKYRFRDSEQALHKGGVEIVYYRGQNETVSKS